MYRIVRFTADGCDMLTRCTRFNGHDSDPVFKPEGDSRIVKYGTRTGALKRMCSLIRAGYKVIVVDDAGAEIPESALTREGRT